MATPTPAIPTFSDGSVLSASQLNALGSNLTNLYNYNQGGFNTQRPAVIAQQTTGQAINNQTDTLVSFNSTTVNTNNMWVASNPTYLTIQTAGIYWLFSQTRWPTIGSPTLNTVCASNIMANGTNVQTNTIASNLLPFVSNGAGCGNQCGIIANLTAGTNIYLDVWQSSGATQTLATNFGGTFLGAIFLTPSS